MSALKALVRKGWHELPWAWRRPSFAQEGEDLVLDRIFARKARGFYVDIGSHHPFRFSNSYLFYRRGWSGICVDPLPGSAARFRRWRSRDTALEIGVSMEPGQLTYHMFAEPAFNTFDPQLAGQRDGVVSRMVATRVIATDRLEAILSRSCPAGQPIDFLSVDVEGLDLAVLSSNDWRRFRPKAVVAECADSELLALDGDPVVSFLAGVGYRAFAKTGFSVVFVDAET